MPVRQAEAVWEGGLQTGRGTLQFGAGRFSGAYSAGSRFAEQPGTNPEELIGAAHAGCFSMAFSLQLEQAGYTPERIHTQARVHLDRDQAGYFISAIELNTEARVPGIDEAAFQEQARQAKAGCPVSRALGGTPIHLTARRLQ